MRAVGRGKGPCAKTPWNGIAGRENGRSVKGVRLEFRWDEEKNADDGRSHGLDFRVASTVLRGDVIEFEDDRYDYGEQRFIAIGFASDGILTTVVYTERDGATRIISAWRSNAHERRRFDRERF